MTSPRINKAHTWLLAHARLLTSWLLASLIALTITGALKSSATNTVASATTGKAVADSPAKKSKGKEPKDAFAPVLDPKQFTGLASLGYAAAKACPQVMAKLFCYCGCDLTDSHSSLLDCFTCLHGVDCHICIEEALLALRLNKKGVPIAEIQKQIDERYASQYPFEEDTPTYKKYKAGRLWIKGKSKEKTETSSKGSSNVISKDQIKLKPGVTLKSRCCSGEKKAKS